MNSKIFLDNKYNKWYYQIVTRAFTRKTKGERHHIVPEAFFKERKRKGPKGWLPGNPDIKDNLVKLTPREHFICHWLLLKMTEGQAKSICVYALNGMKRKNKNQTRYETPITSRVYEKLKKDFGLEHSAKMKGRTPWNKGYKETRPEVLARVKTAAIARDPQTPEQRENQAQKTRGQKRTVEQKENHSKILKQYYEENPRGPMSDEGKRIRSESTIGKAKPAGMGDKLSATIAKQLAEGTHYSQNKKQCPHCPVKASKGKYNKYHGDKCKQKP
jgi:hypothetical protein